MHSIIVFSNNCELKKITVKSSNVEIIKRNQMKQSLKKILVNTSLKLTSEEIKMYAKTLESFIQVDEETKQLHNEMIKEKLTR